MFVMMCFLSHITRMHPFEIHIFWGIAYIHCYRLIGLLAICNNYPVQQCNRTEPPYTTETIHSILSINHCTRSPPLLCHVRVCVCVQMGCLRALDALWCPLRCTGRTLVVTTRLMTILKCAKAIDSWIACERCLSKTQNCVCGCCCAGALWMVSHPSIHPSIGPSTVCSRMPSSVKYENKWNGVSSSMMRHIRCARHLHALVYVCVCIGRTRSSLRPPINGHNERTKSVLVAGW